MKKILLTFTGVLLALIIGLGLYMMFGIKEIPTETALPSGAIAYMRVNHLRSYQTGFVESPLFKVIQELDLEKLVEDGVLTEEKAQQIGFFRFAMTDDRLWDTVEKFFGQQMAVAIYSFDIDSRMLQKFDFEKDVLLLFNIVQEVFGNVIMTTKVGKDVQAVEQLWRIFGEGGSDIVKDSFEYNGLQVQKLVLKNTPFSIYYVRNNDLIAFTIGEQAIKNVADVMKKAKPGLNTDARLVKSGAWDSPANALYGYVDLEYFINKFKEMADGLDAVVNSIDEEDLGAKELAQIANYEQVAKNLNRADGLKTLSMALQHPGPLVIDSNLNFNETQLDASVKDSYVCSNAQNRTVDFVPDGVLGYYWVNCFNMSDVWLRMQEEWSARGSGTIEKIKMLETAWGVSIEDDVLPVIGDELGGYLADIQTGGLFPAF